MSARLRVALAPGEWPARHTSAAVVGAMTRSVSDAAGLRPLPIVLAAMQRPGRHSSALPADRGIDDSGLQNLSDAFFALGRFENGTLGDRAVDGGGGGARHANALVVVEVVVRQCAADLGNPGEDLGKPDEVSGLVERVLHVLLRGHVMRRFARRDLRVVHIVEPKLCGAHGEVVRRKGRKETSGASRSASGSQREALSRGARLRRETQRKASVHHPRAAHT